jgi:hypothetical protein
MTLPAVALLLGLNSSFITGTGLLLVDGDGAALRSGWLEVKR